VSYTEGACTIKTSLKSGEEGVEVSKLQNILKDIGVYSGPITGFFGSLTENAVVRFQKANAIDAIGEVGPLTRSLLNSIINR